MASLKRNIVANYIGKLWSSLIGIIFIPIYIHFIGIEAYGLLGIFAAVQIILGLLDMGLSTTLNRELARLGGAGGRGQYMNNLVFTMEIFYLVVSILIALALTTISFFFAAQWVKADKMPADTITTVFILMTINFAIQFPGSLYQGGLMGLQKQVSLNVITTVFATLKAVGAVFILWFISPTILAFLYWQIFLSILQLFFLRKYLWKYLPVPQTKPRFDRETIRNSGRYAAGIMSMSFLIIILTQSDKIILSKLVTLTNFGYYTLAATISGVLSMVLSPVTGAVFPRITELLSKDNKEKFLELFHSSCQTIAFIIIPMGISLFIFAHDIILAWTRNPDIAKHAGPIMKFLVLGTTVNGLMTIPYQYTLSIGWLRWGINITIVAIIVFLPAIFFAVNKYGAVGGAFIWMVLNIGYLLFAMIYLFSRQLQAEKLKWYLQDVGRPMLTCVVFAAPFFLINEYWKLNNFESLLLFGFCLSVCYLATLWIGLPELRKSALLFVSKFRRGKAIFL